MSDPRQTPNPSPTTPNGPTQTPTQTLNPENTTTVSENAAASAAPGSILDETKEAEQVEEPFNEEKLTLPEGFEKGEGWDEFKDIASKLPHSAAQKLIGLAEKTVNAQAEKLYSTWNEQQVTWQKEIKADPELGGANFDGMKQTVAKLLDNPELSDPKLREALTFTGAGNHPAVVRSLYKYAKVLTEGASTQGSPPGRNAEGGLSSEPRSAAQSLYGPDGPHTGGPKL